MELCRSFDHVGLMARNVEDVQTVRADIDPVDLFEMSTNVPDSHPPGIKSDDPLAEPVRRFEPLV